MIENLRIGFSGPCVWGGILGPAEDLDGWVALNTMLLAKLGFLGTAIKLLIVEAKL